MTKITYNVCVLTVTYGNRWHFLKQILERVLLWRTVHQVVVVDNHSDYQVDTYVKEFADDRIKVLPQADNLGSAGGYKAGLQYIMRLKDCDFIWLLDDDNLPAVNALSVLEDAWINIAHKNEKIALYSLRLDRMNHIKIAQGECADQYYLVPNNFMGFSFTRIVGNQVRKIRTRRVENTARPLKPVKLPYVPYGGLFMHYGLVRLIGYPDERFFVYVDDSEYTFRITKAGGEIWLIPMSTIADLDTSQGIDYKHTLFRSQVLDLWNFRTFYQVRNRMYFYTRNAVTNKWLFKVNRGLYMFGQFLISRLTGKQKAYEAFKEAIEDGITGRLGKTTKK